MEIYSDIYVLSEKFNLVEFKWLLNFGQDSMLLVAHLTQCLNLHLESCFLSCLRVTSTLLSGVLIVASTSTSRCLGF